MRKKERVIAAIEGRETDHTATGFSLHFPREISFGEEAVKAHLDFFRKTDTDIFKIMNENLVPDAGEIKVPEDWDRIPSFSMKDGFMEAQLRLVEAVVQHADPDGFKLGTIHGICASGIHPIEARYGYEGVRKLLCSHIRENKKPVLEAFKRIADGMCLLAERYIELGVDGIYYAALGGEKHYFTDEEFAECIEPFDKQILNTIKEAGGYTFLHMCKEGLEMKRYESYGELADVVNWGVYETGVSLEEGRHAFSHCAVMGGLANRSGVMVDGTDEELIEEVRRIITEFGKKGFILGADCTLPTEIPYERIKLIVDAARSI